MTGGYLLQASRAATVSAADARQIGGALTPMSTQYSTPQWSKPSRARQKAAPPQSGSVPATTLSSATAPSLSVRTRRTESVPQGSG
jgi:hypothetical protein